MAREARVLSHPLVRGVPPLWAAEWGQDRFGPFVIARFGDVRQRFRWIPSGTFWMGSPEGEVWRSDEEGPQHPVTLTEGLWLADTPCTQELWKVVVGDSPSRFEGPQHPVESVSHEQVTREFLPRLAERFGFQGSLPTEAQWERACRAGTQGATYVDGSPLGALGWYSRNSKKSTHPVGQKQANPWGLYDMLGNVLEWCADSPRSYPVDGTTEDPVGEGASRVFRGGSWGFSARALRAAFRFAHRPGFRNDFLGFRLARGQDSAPSEGGGAAR